MNKCRLQLMTKLIGWLMAAAIILIRPGNLLANGNLSNLCSSPPPYRLGNQPLSGMILPHHETAKMVWEPTVSQLAEQKVQRIILLSPNHFWLGKQSIVTASIPSDQVNLSIGIDQKLVTLINQSFSVEDNPEIVWHDHGVTNFVPLLKEKLPDVQVVPILFKKTVSLKQIDGLIEKLTPYLDSQTAIIASLDFAHDVVPPTAAKNDQLAKYLIIKRDYKQILKLSSAYVDSPAALVVFLKLMETKKTQLNLVWQSHAGEFNQNCRDETTSYQVWIGHAF